MSAYNGKNSAKEKRILASTSHSPVKFETGETPNPYSLPVSKKPWYFETSKGVKIIWAADEERARECARSRYLGIKNPKDGRKSKLNSVSKTNTTQAGAEVVDCNSSTDGSRRRRSRKLFATDSPTTSSSDDSTSVSQLSW